MENSAVVTDRYTSAMLLRCERFTDDSWTKEQLSMLNARLVL